MNTTKTKKKTTNRDRMRTWVLEAVHELGGTTTSMDVRKQLWKAHKRDLEKAEGDLFYTWQETVKSVTLDLRKSGVLKPAQGDGVLALTPAARRAARR